MSHITRIKNAKLKDAALLCQALENLELAVEYAQDNTLSVGLGESAMIRTQIKSSARYNYRQGEQVGFARQTDGTFSTVGDFYWAAQSAEEFTAEVTQAYVLVAALQMLAQQGYMVETQERRTDGAVRVTMGRI